MTIVLSVAVTLGLCFILLHVRYPFIFRHVGPQMWSIGIGRINSLTDKIEPFSVISHKDIKQINGIDYIADPFFYKKGDVYYLFVEAAVENFGRVDVLTSTDLHNWTFEGIALERKFHLSYPQVVTWKDQVYMIPETKGAEAVSLYSTKQFPLKWEKQRDLIRGKYLDATLVVNNDEVYLFAADRDYKLFCFVSDDLEKGEFTEHPMSPLGIGEKMRPAGRPIQKEGELILPVQSRRKGYGYAVYSLIISDLSPQIIKYKKGGALVKPLKHHQYFKHGIHHLDIQKDSDGFVFVMDGRVGTKVTYWRINWQLAWSNHINDVRSFFIMRRNNKRSEKISNTHCITK